MHIAYNYNNHYFKKTKIQKKTLHIYDFKQLVLYYTLWVGPPCLQRLVDYRCFVG